jgi:hypothetical protein
MTNPGGWKSESVISRGRKSLTEKSLFQQMSSRVRATIDPSDVVAQQLLHSPGTFHGCGNYAIFTVRQDSFSDPWQRM